MYRLSCCLFVSGLAAFLVACSGCSGGADVVKTELVEGVVTLDGTPVADATVTFQPVTEGQGLPAVGITDEKGSYKLTAQPAGGQTAEIGGGTVPGEYNVSVTKIDTGETMTDEEMEEQEASAMPKSPQVKYIVPQKYNDPQKSGLKVTVQEGTNNIPLELKSGP